MTVTAQVELKSGRVYAPADSTVSTPHVNESVGSDRSPSQISTADPAVANVFLPQWQSTSRNPPPDLLWQTRAASCQGLTLVHFSAQRKHVLWDTSGA